MQTRFSEGGPKILRSEKQSRLELVRGAVASGSIHIPGSSLEMQTLSSSPDPMNQNLHFHKIPR